MVMKWTAVCLAAAAMLGCFCDAQYGTYYEESDPVNKPAPSTFQKPAPRPPVRHPAKKTAQEPVQSKQTFEPTLTWRFPEDPQPEPQPEVPFQLSHPVPAVTVAVECRESDIHVEVKKDMFGTGHFINSADLTLGTCAAVGEDNAAQVLIYQSELQECGSRVTMTNDALIYTFKLNYNPQPALGSLVLRTSDAAAVIVECHYPRNHNVSSLPLDPVWIPFSATKVSEELLFFTLKLMTGDWQYERPVYQYYLGEMINIEAVVKQYFHVPLRVYVDSCVATISPEMMSDPKYQFIENNGCFVDAKITGSDSKFIPRIAENKLQFQIEAFKFQGVLSGLLYITCHLKATSTGQAIDNEHRACSFMNGWVEASGVNPACGSCDSAVYSPGISSGAATGSWSGHTPSSGRISVSKPGRKSRDVSKVEWEGDVTLGPIAIGERA